ncbi:protein YgfX [Thauera chlorobenzoica]|uniref:protein YgfX n=1 Tax=Thauera chlorobenzoica TaxID=96773 RepID=UPI00089FC3BF|nr:protein YgfX [Thauera chlorobenzoica]SEF39942.1 hypothetical protein SAMN05216242_10173 [Thauera chlorobenzoica]
MHRPLSIELSPSRGVLASVLAVHVAAALALFHALFPMPTGGPEGQVVLAAVAWGLLIASLLRAIRAELGKRGTTLVLLEDGAVEVSSGGERVLCRVGADAVDLGSALWLHLRPGPAADAGGGMPPPPRHGRGVERGRRLMLLPVNLPAVQWRGLRIWLRHRALRGDAGA